jgi:hypothetical protein
MTSQAIRDPLADRLITPQNAAFVFIAPEPRGYRIRRAAKTDHGRKGLGMRPALVPATIARSC